MKQVHVLAKPAFLIWLVLLYGIFSVAFTIYSYLHAEFIQAGIQAVLSIMSVSQYIYLKSYNKYFIRKVDDRLEWKIPGMDDQRSVLLSGILTFEADWRGIQISTASDHFEISFKELEWKETKLIRETFKEFTAQG